MFPHNRIQAMHLQQEYHRDGTAFSLHSTQWHTISIYPTIGGINFIVKKPSKPYLNQKIKVNILLICHVDITYPLTWCDEKGISPLWYSNPNWGEFYQISSQYSSKLSRTLKNQNNNKKQGKPTKQRRQSRLPLLPGDPRKVLINDKKK